MNRVQLEMDCPVCWGSPWQCPCCPHCSLWGVLCWISLLPPPRSQQVGGECRTFPQRWEWSRVLDQMHLTLQGVVASLLPWPWPRLSQWTVPLQSESGCGNCPQGSPETLVREADNMRGMWTGWVLRWFREVGPVRPLVTIDCEYIEMLNFKLGFFAPFSEYYLLFFINSQKSTCWRRRLGELCRAVSLALTCSQ